MLSSGYRYLLHAFHTLFASCAEITPWERERERERRRTQAVQAWFNHGLSAAIIGNDTYLGICHTCILCWRVAIAITAADGVLTTTTRGLVDMLSDVSGWLYDKQTSGTTPRPDATAMA